jgi:hypothetical protein
MRGPRHFIALARRSTPLPGLNVSRFPRQAVGKVAGCRNPSLRVELTHGKINSPTYYPRLRRDRFCAIRRPRRGTKACVDEMSAVSKNANVADAEANEGHCRGGPPILCNGALSVGLRCGPGQIQKTTLLFLLRSRNNHN